MESKLSGECDSQEQNPVLHDVTKRTIREYTGLPVMAGIRNLQLIKQKIQTERGGFDM